jgi:hypothetical protein
MAKTILIVEDEAMLRESLATLRPPARSSVPGRRPPVYLFFFRSPVSILKSLVRTGSSPE